MIIYDNLKYIPNAINNKKQLIIYRIYNLFLFFSYLICCRFMKLYKITKILNIHNKSLSVFKFFLLKERNAIANDTNIIQFLVHDACNVSILNSALNIFSIYNIYNIYYIFLLLLNKLFII